MASRSQEQKINVVDGAALQPRVERRVERQCEECQKGAGNFEFVYGVILATGAVELTAVSFCGRKT